MKGGDKLNADFPQQEYVQTDTTLGVFYAKILHAVNQLRSSNTGSKINVPGIRYIPLPHIL
jgi:hypothetical protein